MPFLKPNPLIAALAIIVVSQAATATQAGQVYLGAMPFGIPAIRIVGPIVPGDDLHFAALLKQRSANVIWLSSEGGDIPTAIAIGRMVHANGLTTVVSRGGYGCYSACRLIWFSGRRAIIQRNSALGFHAGNIPEATAAMTAYLRELGLTPHQIDYMMRTPQPDVQLATEADAMALGFQVQIVTSMFGGWQSCSAQFCLAIP